MTEVLAEVSRVADAPEAGLDPETSAFYARYWLAVEIEHSLRVALDPEGR